nr:cytochrome c3 family protein [Geotalea sp. SG265]
MTVCIGLLSFQNNSFAVYGPKVTEIGNKHNLSYANVGTVDNPITYNASDPNDPRARQICIFCHTPHNAVINRGLWNRQETTQLFGQYSSTSLHIRTDLKSVSDYNEPNGSSRLCLGCHDGVTALGAVVQGPNSGTNIAIKGNPALAMSGTHVFTRFKITNDHHPISFNYAKVQPSMANYKPVPAGGNVKLDHLGRMQCTTCHDPHQTKDTTMPFWVWEYIPPDPYASPANSHDAVCLTCHDFVFPLF